MSFERFRPVPNNEGSDDPSQEVSGTTPEDALVLQPSKNAELVLPLPKDIEDEVINGLYATTLNSQHLFGKRMGELERSGCSKESIVATMLSSAGQESFVRGVRRHLFENISQPSRYGDYLQYLANWSELGMDARTVFRNIIETDPRINDVMISNAARELENNPRRVLDILKSLSSLSDLGFHITKFSDTQAMERAIKLGGVDILEESVKQSSTNSFELFQQYCKELGLKTEQIWDSSRARSDLDQIFSNVKSSDQLALADKWRSLGWWPNGTVLNKLETFRRRRI